MPTIYLVRHGQTDWNAAERLQGQEDTPLNDTGREQAARNGKILRDVVNNPGVFDFVASPLKRTRETMEIVRAEMGLDRAGYRTEPQLMEIHFGDWQGYTWEELHWYHPEETAARFKDPWNTVVPGDGGESYAMLSARAVGWLSTVTSDTIVVTHGGINRCVRGHIEGLPVTEIPHLPVPQDKVLAIENGSTRWI